MPPWGEAVREAYKAIQASMQAGQQGQQLALTGPGSTGN